MTRNLSTSTCPAFYFMKSKMTLISIFLGLFWLIGIVILGWGLLSVKRSLAAANWPHTRGTVLRCNMENKSDSEGGSTQQIKVDYEYFVGSKRYEGTRLAFGYTASSATAGNAQLLNRLQKSKSVDVRYDPNDPANCTLSYGIHRSIQFVLVFGAMWTLFILGFTLITWLMSEGDNVLLKNLITH